MKDEAANRRREALFYDAVRLPESERSAYLDRASDGDPELRGMVDAMLAAHAEAEQFFSERPALVDAAGELISYVATPDPIGSVQQVAKRIGPYKLIEKVGEGGCGVVYMALQEKPMRRQVALKIIKLGMDTKSVIARFDAERQALAMMDHPNIARVLDAGATETGRPYFVMELVRGVKITDYSDQRNLNTRQRLNLFLQVCRAVQHAHQKGIIHRDLKPSNILVTMYDGVPVPKVIDFGIVKAMAEPLTEQTLCTSYHQLIGTPAYMSPEQAEMSGLDLDTRSDIYSLGMLLYELLTGRTPFNQKELLQAGLDEMRRMLRQEEPRRPSSMLTTIQRDELTATALHRGIEPPSLILQLKGDLDWIVMKALEKDRARRYETANGLAMDVERYLSNEPIIARPPSRLYRFQKLVRRNKIVFTAGALVTAALILGLGLSTWMFVREREARREAQRGRDNEIMLRRIAEEREKIAQAAVLVGQARLEEADELISKIPPSENALGGAGVYRTLGDWAAIQGQWHRAALRLRSLIQQDQFDTWDLASLDYSRCAAAALEDGDRESYEAVRQSAIKRFARTTDPLIAERAVKNCLIVPSDSAALAALAPLSDIAAASFSKTGPEGVAEAWMAPWRCVSLAMMEFRREHSAEAVNWCKRCLSYNDDGTACVGTIRAILAMAENQLGQTNEARVELAKSRQLIENKLKGGLDVGNGNEGYWFDWTLGRLLLREASNLIEGPARPDASSLLALPLSKPNAAQ